MPNMSFKDFVNIKKIMVVAPEQLLQESSAAIFEAKTKSAGNYTARKDPPHFCGDEYHGHSKFGRYEVAWTISGKRRHENKFPCAIPADAKQAVADVLGVNVDILECFRAHDTDLGEDVFLVEIKGKLNRTKML